MARRPLSPADVVSGRARASIDELFALIHAINPTGRALSQRQQAEGYALKARLQSLLIRRHADVLDVERDPADERVVSLRHRVAGRDACHAVYASLDDDARRWVETELSRPRRAPTPAPARPTRRPDAPQDALSLGRAALDAYDYEEARSCFERALESGREPIESAVALLDLLVNHLADDGAAVSLGARLSREALADPDVLGRLALAAARSGDRERAVRWCRGASARQASEALVLCAEAAARDGAAAEARTHLAALQDLDPAHPAILRLRDAWARARAAERRPGEQTLAAALAASDWAEVRARAEAILTQWPDSEPARAALRMLESRANADLARALVERAWAASNRGDADAMTALLARVSGLAPDDVELRASIEAAKARARELTELEARHRARRLLAAGASADGLRAWIALPAPAREEIRRSLDLPELRHLDELAAGDGRIEAVLALAPARTALAAGDPDAAERALEPHLRILRNLGDGRRLLADIGAQRAARSAAAQARAREEIATARRDGQFEQALRLASELPADDRRRIRADIEAERARHGLTALRQEALAGGDLLAARQLADRAGDLEAVAAINERIRHDWRIEVFEDLDLPTHDVPFPREGPTPSPWLTPSGAEVVFAEVRARWLFARVVDLATRRVRRMVTLRVPGPMLPHYVLVGDDLLTVVDTCAAVVQIRLSDGHVLRWVPRAPGLPGDDYFVEGSLLAPGGRFVWTSLSTTGGAELRVYDLDRWPTWRAVGYKGFGVPLVGCDEPLMVGIGDPAGARLYTPSGNLAGRGLYGPGTPMTRAAVLPSGVPLCATVDATSKRAEFERGAAPAMAGTLTETPIGFTWMYLGEADGRMEAFRSGSVKEPHQVATSRADGQVYLRTGPGGISQIAVFGTGADGNLVDLDTAFWVPSSTTFVTDARSQHVRALTRIGEEWRLIALDGSEPPADVVEVREASYRTAYPDEGFDFDLGCPFDGAYLTPGGQRIAQELARVAGPACRAWITSFKELNADDPDALFDLAAASGSRDRDGDANEIFEEAGARFPDHPRWRLLKACLDAQNGRWDDALSRLRDVRESDLESGYRQHLHHVRGVARLRAGDLAGGEADLRAGASIEGVCHMQVPVALLDVLAGAPPDATIHDTPSYLRTRIGRLVRSILEADACLARRDPAGAIAAVDHATVWRWADRQALARLAEAWLALPEPEALAEDLRRRYALAAFVGVHEEYLEGRGRDIPIPPHSWGADRLEELAGRARAALERGSAGRSATGDIPLPQ